MKRSREVRWLARFAVLGLAALACNGDSGGGGAPRCAGTPESGVYATFRVVDDHFHASITDPDGIAEAIALWRGESDATIPVGDLVCAPEPWNCLWSWHLVPESVRFAEVAVEVCDGRPSFVEENCEDFASQYCPWSAELVELRDCRSDPACPRIPR